MFSFAFWPHKPHLHALGPTVLRVSAIYEYDVFQSKLKNQDYGVSFAFKRNLTPSFVSFCFSIHHEQRIKTGSFETEGKNVRLITEVFNL